MCLGVTESPFRGGYAWTHYFVSRLQVSQISESVCVRNRRAGLVTPNAVQTASPAWYDVVFRPTEMSSRFRCFSQTCL